MYLESVKQSIYTSSYMPVIRCMKPGTITHKFNSLSQVVIRNMIFTSAYFLCLDRELPEPSVTLTVM